MSQRDNGDDVLAALAAFVEKDAALSCSSSSCPHKRVGMVVNGPCLCYRHNHPMRDYVFAASRLRRALERRLSTTIAYGPGEKT